MPQGVPPASGREDIEHLGDVREIPEHLLAHLSQREIEQRKPQRRDQQIGEQSIAGSHCVPFLRRAAAGKKDAKRTSLRGSLSGSDAFEEKEKQPGIRFGRSDVRVRVGQSW